MLRSCSQLCHHRTAGLCQAALQTPIDFRMFCSKWGMVVTEPSGALLPSVRPSRRRDELGDCGAAWRRRSITGTVMAAQHEAGAASLSLCRRRSMQQAQHHWYCDGGVAWSRRSITGTLMAAQHGAGAVSLAL